MDLRFGIRIQDLGFRIWDLGFRISDVLDLRPWIQGFDPRSWIQCLGSEALYGYGSNALDPRPWIQGLRSKALSNALDPMPWMQGLLSKALDPMPWIRSIGPRAFDPRLWIQRLGSEALDSGPSISIQCLEPVPDLGTGPRVRHWAAAVAPRGRFWVALRQLWGSMDSMDSMDSFINYPAASPVARLWNCFSWVVG